MTATPIDRFNRTVLRADGLVYVLAESLICNLTLDEGVYHIENERFGLTAWGATRKEAETAFEFVFHALYQTFATEDDERLSDEARQLKANLAVARIA